jgi:uncharacterized damage-inducible protein DinB
MLVRPESDEYDDYYRRYVRKVLDGEILELMQSELEETLVLLSEVPPEKEEYRYEPGKWSIREVVGHMIDVERLFGFRALWFARQVAEPLPGMDQDMWATLSRAHERPLSELAEEFALARRSNRAMFASFDDEMAELTGIASGYSFTVRACAYILVGHEVHHRNVLRESYLES